MADNDTFRCIECGEDKDASELEPGFAETCSECVNAALDDDDDDRDDD